MRNLVASLLLAILTLTHGFLRAGSKLHHFFGAVFVVVFAAIAVPVAFAQKLIRREDSRGS